MTSGHNSLNNLNLFRLAFPLSTLTRKLQYLLTSLHGFRPGLVASFHTALVPSLTLVQAEQPLILFDRSLLCSARHLISQKED